MLNLGWSEMLIVAAIALIVVGPKDLPVMLRQLGRVFGTMRRMGNEFKSEINKVAALDEVKDIKNSIAEPLKNTHQELTNQFNAIDEEGNQKPSGALTPKQEGKQSVAEEIREAAGLPPVPPPDPKAAASSMKTAIARADAKPAADGKDTSAPKSATKRKATTNKAPAKPHTAKKTATLKSTTRQKAATKKPKTAQKNTSTRKTATARRTASKKATVSKGDA